MLILMGKRILKKIKYPKLKPNEFRCEECGGVFEFEEEWTEERALAEYWKIFGKLPDALKRDKAELCDDCYRKLMIKIRQ